jgi:serine beta-lactamase-like protein LACTB
MPRLTAILALLVAAALLAGAPARSADTLPPDTVSRIQGLIRQEMDAKGIPGLTAAVAVGGELSWSQGFGMSDLENQVAAKAETVYRLGSIAKPFAAVAAMQLFESGRLDLDAPVQRYVPTFPPKAWPVTCRQLLGHLGGIRHYRGDEVNSTRYYPTLTEGLTIFSADPLLHEPGTKYQYTTYGFNLLGCAVEGASGQSFMAYLHERVFRPAGLLQTRDDSVADLIPHRAQGYRKLPSGQLRNSNLADTSYKIPGGGLCGTAADMVRFGLAVADGRLVRPSTRELMWTRQRLKDGTETAYGLGWALSTRDGRREVAHGGGQQRITTYLYLLPEERRVVALMSNLEGAALAPLARRVADATR